MAKKPTKYLVTDGELVLTLEVAEEGGFLVTSPFNPDVLTEADTLEEAFEMARDVIQTYKEYRAQKQPAARGVPKGGKRVDKSAGGKKAAVPEFALEPDSPPARRKPRSGVAS
jgi:antitoxin HicB